MKPVIRLKGRQVKKRFGMCRVIGFVSVLALFLVGLALQGTAGAATLTHPFDQALSHEGTLNRPCGAATDLEGDLYVAYLR